MWREGTVNREAACNELKLETAILDYIHLLFSVDEKYTQPQTMKTACNYIYTIFYNPPVAHMYIIMYIWATVCTEYIQWLLLEMRTVYCFKSWV